MNDSLVTQGYRDYLCLHSTSLLSSENDNILWAHSTEALIYKDNKKHTKKLLFVNYHFYGYQQIQNSVQVNLIFFPLEE